jgi:hypothetical protein
MATVLRFGRASSASYSVNEYAFVENDEFEGEHPRRVLGRGEQQRSSDNVLPDARRADCGARCALVSVGRRGDLR